MGEPGVDEGLARDPLLDALRGPPFEALRDGNEDREWPIRLRELSRAASAHRSRGGRPWLSPLAALPGTRWRTSLTSEVRAAVCSPAFWAALWRAPDAINTVSVFVTNDEATYLLKRPQDFAPDEIPTLVELARRGELVEPYRKGRIKIADGRAAPPVEPGYNFNINRWALYAPGGTYFLPVRR